MRPRGLVFVGWLSVLAAVVDAKLGEEFAAEGSGGQEVAPLVSSAEEDLVTGEGEEKSK